jgi:hypothetical protein
VTLDTKLARNPNLTTAALDGEVVMLSLETNRYYGLNSVGSRIWEILAQPMTLAAVCDILLQEYTVTRAQCEREVIALAKKLLDEKLAFVADTTV